MNGKRPDSKSLPECYILLTKNNSQYLPLQLDVSVPTVSLCPQTPEISLVTQQQPYTYLELSDIQGIHPVTLQRFFSSIPEVSADVGMMCYKVDHHTVTGCRTVGERLHKSMVHRLQLSSRVKFSITFDVEINR